MRLRSEVLQPDSRTERHRSVAVAEKEKARNTGANRYVSRVSCARAYACTYICTRKKRTERIFVGTSGHAPNCFKLDAVFGNCRFTETVTSLGNIVSFRHLNRSRPRSVAVMLFRTSNRTICDDRDSLAVRSEICRLVTKQEKRCPNGWILFLRSKHHFHLS